jgi:hypothetical protein
MHYDFSTGTIVEYFNIMEDIVTVFKWNYYETEDLLKIEDKTWKIIYHSNDTLILQYPKTGNKRVLINLKDKNPEFLKDFRSCSY